MAALTLDRLSREWGHQWHISAEADRHYRARRLRPRGGDIDEVCVRTLRALRRRLEELDTTDRDAGWPPPRAPLPRRDRTKTYFPVPPAPGRSTG